MPKQVFWRGFWKYIFTQSLLHGLENNPTMYFHYARQKSGLSISWHFPCFFRHCIEFLLMSKVHDAVWIFDLRLLYVNLLGTRFSTSINMQWKKLSYGHSMAKQKVIPKNIKWYQKNTFFLEITRRIYNGGCMDYGHQNIL